MAGGSGGVAGSAGSTAGSSGTAGGGGAGGVGGLGGSAGGTALIPCTDPAVSRLKVWETQIVGGTMVPASGSPLREAAGGHEVYIEWTLQDGGAYGTANAPLDNQGEYENGANPADHGVDISAASGITLEYATTGATYVQLRTASVPHGGDHFRADMPVTAGELESATLDFSDFRRPGGDVAPGDEILSEVFSLTFVAAATTTLTLRQVLIPGHTPPCD